MRSLQKNANPEAFLWADSQCKIPEDPQRVVIFATHRNISRLESSKVLYCDGTFDSSPSLFYQLVTLHVNFRGKVLPVVYALLPSKERKTYDKFFKMLLSNDWNDKCSSRRIQQLPQLVICDFEKALIESIKACLCPEVAGCYFHLTQNLFKHLKDKVGLMVRKLELSNSKFKLKSQTIKKFYSERLH